MQCRYDVLLSQTTELIMRVINLYESWPTRQKPCKQMLDTSCIVVASFLALSFFNFLVSFKQDFEVTINLLHCISNSSLAEGELWGNYVHS